MKQILQDLKAGETLLADVPCPAVKPGTVLIRSRRTLVSAGTERMLVAFGKANLIDKARQQPSKVKQVIEKARTDGLMPTLDAVRRKLDSRVPLGYCNAGVVMEVGEGVDGFQVGNRVVSNGSHAEVVRVPRLLCARVPDGVSDEDAAFTVAGAISLQGVRLLEPTLGETVVVTGLGLLGLLAVQILRANGCRVLGIDFDSARCALAEQFGATVVDLSSGGDAEAAALAMTGGRGVDAVVITASTKSNDVVHQAASMCRKRGRIVLVGVVGLELDRADFYEKELSFQVSCSYGPGRYDPSYEDGGADYPLGFVRWTEQRNFEAVLQLMEAGQLDLAPLRSHRVPLERAVSLYEELAAGGGVLGAILEYAEETPDSQLRARTVAGSAGASGRSGRGGSARRSGSRGACIGVIGAGGYGAGVLLPALKDAGARLRTIVSSGGVSAAQAGQKFGFEQSSTDVDAVFGDDGIDAVVIATRHDSHARFAKRAMEAGKAVFVEKPLALTEADLDELEAVWTAAGEPILTVGFNRRFAPLVVQMKELLGTVREPLSFVMTVNAGVIPADHWVHDPVAGGGRIAGEGCHFIDLLRHLARGPIESVQVTAMGRRSDGQPSDDKASIGLTFADGSHGTVHYLANGARSYPKERLEVFGGGRVLALDNFRSLQGWGWPGFKKRSLRSQDKGNAALVRAFVESLRRGSEPPIPVAELFEVSRATLQAAQLVLGG